MPYTNQIPSFCSRIHDNFQKSKIIGYCTNSDCKIKLMCHLCVDDYHAKHHYVKFTDIRQGCQDIIATHSNDKLIKIGEDFKAQFEKFKCLIISQLNTLYSIATDKYELLEQQYDLITKISLGKYHSISEQQIVELLKCTQFSELQFKIEQELFDILEQVRNASDALPMSYTKLLIETIKNQDQLRLFTKYMAFDANSILNPEFKLIRSINPNCVYFGEIKNNKFHGKGDWEDGNLVYGRLCSAESQIRIWEGQFENGKLNGRGKLIKNGQVYDGTFINNRKKGNGVMYKVDNIIDNMSTSESNQKYKQFI